MPDPRRSIRSERSAPGPLAAASLALALWLVALFSNAWSGNPDPRPCVPMAEESAYEGRTAAVRCADLAAPSPDWMRGAARLLFDLPIDVNRADTLTLESLPGIGPGRAHAIDAARCQRRFESVDDLQRVRGIGPRTVEGLSAEATAGGVDEPGFGVACPQGSR